MIGTIRQISRIGEEELSFEWRIRGALSTISGWDIDWLSPEFRFDDECWWLNINCNNWTSRSLRLCLIRGSVGSPSKTFHISLGIKLSGGGEKRKKTEKEFSYLDNSLIWDDFCLISELIGQQFRLMLDGVLTVTCVLKTGSARANELKREIIILKEQIEEYEDHIHDLNQQIHTHDSDIKNHKSLNRKLEKKLLCIEKDYTQQLQTKSCITCKLEKGNCDYKAQINKLQEDYQILLREKIKLEEEKSYFEIEFKKIKESAPFRNQGIVGKEDKTNGLERVHRNKDSSFRSLSSSFQNLMKIPPDISTLHCDFSDLYADEICPNFVLNCNEWSIPVNTFVLSVRSEVFRDMFQNMVQENEIRSADIKDLEVSILISMLKFLYCGKLKEVSQDTVIHLYEAGDKYACSLKVACYNWMKRNLTRENCITFLKVANSHSDQDLKAAVVLFIIRHPEVMKTSAWLEYSNEHPKLAIDILQTYISSIIS